MYMNKVSGLLVFLCCELCLTIKVPTIWDESGNRVVNHEYTDQVEIARPQNVQTPQQSQSVPVEYFQYTAQKPQFATNIAAFHGVKDPHQHYKAYPIKPYSGKKIPVLGIHHMLNKHRPVYQPYRNYVQNSERIKDFAQPVSASYDIFHPYKAEEPALQEMYKDPTLLKIRNDLEDSKNRLHTYEQDAGKLNIADDEYLESVDKTDAKLFPQKNKPTPYEIHRPERRPVYYRVLPQNSNRDHILNQRLKHPWKHQNIKIKPLHYKPLKNHLQNLRQQHAMKYDDEQNEYPQVHIYENLSDPVDGYDIYEKGKEKYTQFRNNIDESINKAVQENRPKIYKQLELQKIEPKHKDEDDEFVPVKNYAQVRKTETIKHLPRKAAYDDAETYEEVINAPRLREAIKSTKAQVVYSEEGYEDSAYDHAGEHKHASDHEGHGGFLKETAKSGGLYKIPTVLDKYQDGRGSEYRDNIEHGEKWKNADVNNEEDIKSEDYSENEHIESIEADNYDDNGPEKSSRNKREDEHKQDSNNSIYINDNDNDSLQKREQKNIDHELDEQETKFELPTINLNTTYLNEDEILKIAKQQIIPKTDNIKNKYPYYFLNLKSIHKDSPLRYAENLKFIPKKSEGGTEFYDSRSKVECPEVDYDIDPVPEKLKNGEDPTQTDMLEVGIDSNNTEEGNTMKKQTRLNGLGDKIDCLKAKYFGENPLDSPFFKEEIILNPEPITKPKLFIYEHLRNVTKQNSIDLSKKLTMTPKTDPFVLLDELRINNTLIPLEPLYKFNESLITKLHTPEANIAAIKSEASNIYTDVLNNIKNDLQPTLNYLSVPPSLSSENKSTSNKIYNFFKNKDKVIKLPQKLRRKRAVPFTYEPYKIIRDSQYQDSKKTTTTSNISPLIRQLQTSKVGDQVSKLNQEDNKPNIGTRTYVDLGKNNRLTSNISPTIVDISVDHRRGEPRYEIRHNNHKSEYTPVENKRIMSIEDYKSRTATEKANDSTAKKLQATIISTRGQQRFRHSITTMPPAYDMTSYLSKLSNTQKASASNAVRQIVSTTTPTVVTKEIEQIEHTDDENEDSYEDYDEEEDVENSEEDTTTTTTTTTTTVVPKPMFRKRTKVSTTTANIRKQTNEAQPERLKLVTRFRNYKPPEEQEEIGRVTEPSVISKYKTDEHSKMPKYSEKKKKTSETTIVTDTNQYGDDDNSEEIDTENEEVEIDALIGVKQNMNDYMPLYEKKEQNKEEKSKQHETESIEDDEDSEDDDIDDSDSEEDDEDDIEEEDDNGEEANVSEVATTPEPLKRTLSRTTEAPPPTVASHIKVTSIPLHDLRTENKPIITKKKIEIHKELPVNKSSPHVTEFKQDIKEIEIIKEMPTAKRKSQKIKPLELYKDDNLAKDINKLKDVEVFKEDIDLEKGPKHGGNFRRANKEDLKLLKLAAQDSGTPAPVKDVEASQSENRKRVELDDYAPTSVQRLHGGNLKSLSDFHRTRNTRKNAQLVELSNAPIIRMHGGNLKLDNKRREGRRNEKLIELDDDSHDDDSSHDDDYKSSPHNSRHDRLHGGNYRSAKLVTEKVKNPAREARRSATVLLNNFVQAVPVLTTTPGYILDPSKRMYYYVDV